MAKVKTSPAPAKSGQAKTGTTKAKAVAHAAVEPTGTGAAVAPAVALAESAAAGSAPIQAVAPTGVAPTETIEPVGDPGALPADNGTPPGDPVASPGDPVAPPGDPVASPGDDGAQGLALLTITDESALPAPGERQDLHEGGAGGELSESARLANHSNTVHRIVKAGISLAPGESALIEFSSEKHREQCEKHVAQIRSLHRWADGEGLHWRADE